MPARAYERAEDDDSGIDMDEAIGIRVLAAEMGLSPAAATRLSEQYELGTIAEAWRRGDYGTLRASDTGEEIGPATREQAIISYEAGHEGHAEITLCAENGRERGTVDAYVEP